MVLHFYVASLIFSKHKSKNCTSRKIKMKCLLIMETRWGNAPTGCWKPFGQHPVGIEDIPG
jgi:hypothetical protein